VILEVILHILQSDSRQSRNVTVIR
jgi:hypothetical protein